MRVLLLFRGAPGSGKSTWIKEHGLEAYAISADNIRTAFQNPVLNEWGEFGISQKNDKLVWEFLFKILNARMERGDFTIVDATNSRTEEMNKYKKLAAKYRYRIYIIDKTGLPIEECKRRNASREAYKVVPSSVIDKMYARFATQTVPCGIKVITEDQADQMWYKPSDFSSWKKIHHIGDIHGCATALKQCINNCELNDDELYIFLGDYIDRGLENAEVLKILLSIYKKDNVLLLEGNHEANLWKWANGITTNSSRFELITKPTIEEAGINPSDIRQLYRKMCQCAYYTYGDKTVIVTHGGLSFIPDNLTLVATEQLINGVGRFDAYDAATSHFEKFVREDPYGRDMYQIFGHRNPRCYNTKMSEHCFDLEGQVEFGGCLREAILDKDGWTTHQYKNSVFNEVKETKPKEESELTDEERTTEEVINAMRKDKYINEKRFGDISSFNFTRGAFNKKEWNERTTKARGLFINTVDNTVVARSYDKFFNLHEVPTTRYEYLAHNLEFPVTAYLKENGFLAMMSYNKVSEEIFIATKSTAGGDMAAIAREILFDQIKGKESSVKKFPKDSNSTMVFEIVDPERDPHIIKYEGKHAFLLDIVQNSISYEKKPFDELCKIANLFGFEHKKKAYEINTWDELVKWIDLVSSGEYQYNNKFVEGFVIEDSKGFMFKLKTSYYLFWKRMRGVADEVLRQGSCRRTGCLNTKIENEFYGWVKGKYGHYEKGTDIITLRDKFIEERI